VNRKQVIDKCWPCGGSEELVLATVHCPRLCPFLGKEQYLHVQASSASFQSEQCRINSCKPTRFIHWLLFFIQFSFPLCSLSSSLGFGYLSVQHSEPFTCQFSSTSPIEDTPPLNSRTTICSAFYFGKSTKPFSGAFFPQNVMQTLIRILAGTFNCSLKYISTT